MRIGYDFIDRYSFLDSKTDFTTYKEEDFAGIKADLKEKIDEHLALRTSI